MAFLNRIGNVLKQSISKHELSASNASLYQAIRSMSSSKLFVGGLSYGTDENSLREAFSQHGEVVEARVILDRETGRSRGFGFISYPSSEEATNAMQAMDGQDLHGRRIRVNFATERSRAGFGGGYGSGGGGSYNYGGQGGNFGAGGYAANNYGGGGGGFSGSAGGGSYGSSGGFNYGAESGNSAGAGGYPTSNYGGGGGGFSGGNSSAGGYGSYGGGGNYASDNSYPIDGGNRGGGAGYGGGNYGSAPSSNYSGKGSNLSGGYGGGNSGNDFVGVSSNNDGFADARFGGSTEASFSGGQEQLGADQATQSITEDFGQEASEGNFRDDDDEPKDYAKDDDDEPKDYANTRG